MEHRTNQEINRTHKTQECKSITENILQIILFINNLILNNKNYRKVIKNFTNLKLKHNLNHEHFQIKKKCIDFAMSKAGVQLHGV